MKISEKVDFHTHVNEEKFTLKPSFPDTIKIELTANCNYRCYFCALKSNLREKRNINKELLFRILKEARDIGVKEIGMFLLGESFLLNDLSKYIKYAKDIGIEYVFITTNGFLCNEERLRKVLDAGLDSIKFSINAGTKETYKKIHGVDGYDVVMENLVTLNRMVKEGSYKIKTGVSSIYDEEIKEELIKMKGTVSELVEDFYFLPLYNQAGHCSTDGKIVGNPGRLEKMVPPIPCWALFNSAKITWDGWLTACCFDHDERFKIADLNKVSLLEAWHHEKFQDLRGHHIDNDLYGTLCSKCLGLD